MQITINIPDKLYHDIEKSGEDVESSIIQALELYTEQEKPVKNNRFIKLKNLKGKINFDENTLSELRQNSLL
jgi:uncharacterized metal-binding protein YceD (DUF177 family)